MDQVTKAFGIHGLRIIELLPYAGLSAMRANRAALEHAGIAHPDTTVGAYWGSPDIETILAAPWAALLEDHNLRVTTYRDLVAPRGTD